MKLTAQNTYPKIQIEQLTQSHWSEQEKSNALLIADFMQNLMNDHNFDYVLENYNNDEYVQHNRALENGVEGLIKYIKKFAKQFPE